VRAFAAAGGLILLLVVLWDAFETLLLPRRVSGAFRLGRDLQFTMWRIWSSLARGAPTRRRREEILSPFAMSTMLVLIVVWALGIALSFGFMQWGVGSRMADVTGIPAGIFTDLYMSGSTFFTLGLGDVSPTTPLARLLCVIEAGMGLGFLAMVVSYLPVLYQSFSRREARIVMLDEWAGSPPTPAVLLKRVAEVGEGHEIGVLLHDWEQWSAELLESHLSYSILAYFRSQHDNQSWLASLTSVLDTCSLVMAGIEGMPTLQARLTFAIARHAMVDLSQVLRCRPIREGPDRLPPEDLATLRALLTTAGLKPYQGAVADHQLNELRALYEPYARALGAHLLMELPNWLPPEKKRFNWETTAWMRTGEEEAH